MNALPTTFTEWLGGDSFLLEICPARENRGAEVQRIQELSPEALTEGRRIACGASLELVRGGLLYALDALSAAHEIFQRDSTALGSYWHGMMHRREGDFGNACYWFRAAGRVEALAEWPEFDPIQFTMRCSRNGRADAGLLADQRREWDTLMRFCFNQAVVSRSS